MKIARLSLMGLVCATALLGTSEAFANPPPPPPPPGVALPPGYNWCPRCGGHGRVASGFLGWKSKKCPDCRGTGMMAPPMAMPPPPRPHAGGAPHPGGPRPGAHRPAPPPGRRPEAKPRPPQGGGHPGVQNRPPQGEPRPGAQSRPPQKGGRPDAPKRPGARPNDGQPGGRPRPR